MKIAVFALNQQSLEVARTIAGSRLYQAKIYAGKNDRGSLGELVAAVYDDYEGLVFVMAAGIVVRLIAPLLKNKAWDPAVLVIDPQGGFVISLLAGHLGGANRLAREVAALLGAAPVITTATDVLDKQSIEEWATSCGLGIANLDGLVKINGALVRGESLTVYSELSPEYWGGNSLAEPEKILFLPLSELAFSKPAGAAIVITRTQTPLAGKADLRLLIRNLVVGIGCRQGTSKDRIKEFLQEILAEQGLDLKAVKKLVSIDLKQKEAGLADLARDLKIPSVFYRKEELIQVLSEHPELSCSEFVQKQVGVGGVCEPAAILGSRQGSLVVRKQARRGITLAVAEEKLPLWA